MTGYLRQSFDHGRRTGARPAQTDILPVKSWHFADLERQVFPSHHRSYANRSAPSGFRRSGGRQAGNYRIAVAQEGLQAFTEAVVKPRLAAEFDLRRGCVAAFRKALASLAIRSPKPLLQHDQAHRAEIETWKHHRAADQR